MKTNKIFLIQMRITKLFGQKERKENKKRFVYIKDVFHNFGGGQITCTQKGVNTSGVLDFSHIFFLFVLFLITGRLWVGWPFFSLWPT